MPSKTQSILLGGVAAGIVALLFGQLSNVNQSLGMVASCLSCLVYIGAGLLAVWHYTNEHQLTIAGGQGAGMGALAGLLAGLVAGLIAYLLIAMNIVPGPEEVLERMRNQPGMDEMTDEQLASTQRMIGLFAGPLGMIVGAVIGAILGAIGGAIGAAVFKKGGEAPLA